MNILSAPVTLKEAFQTLSPEDKAQLMYALEAGISQWVVMGNMFLGVNVEGVPQLNILETSGQWAYGELK